jgi:DNA-binding LacI/PurR family transcriptional regulator
VAFGGRPVNAAGTDNYVVEVDNIESASVAIRYLIDHGRKRIATIAGGQDMAAGLDRFERWKVGFDYSSTTSTPPLMTVAQPSVVLGSCPPSPR